MKYFVELADDVRSPQNTVILQMGRVYPLDQWGEITSNLGMELTAEIWQDEYGYIVEINK